MRVFIANLTTRS